MSEQHLHFMMLAIAEAKKAGQKKEVPIGAVVVDANGRLLATAHNQVVALSDASAHAEMLALRAACRLAGNYRLPGSVLYVTVEPCPMCMGALIHARVARLIFGAADPKWGAAGSLYDFAADNRFNHQPEVIAGVCEDTCRQLMQDFFRSRRKC